MPLIAIFLLSLLVHIICAIYLPVVQDEAYYFAWAKSPAFGYFDHPPLVAWISWAANLVPNSPIIARLGTILASAAMFPATQSLLRNSGLTSQKSLIVGMILANFSLAGIIAGFLTTPDTILVLAWIVALNEAVCALRGQRWRWLTAGAATGVGILAKYTMVLVGPVFLWALVKTSPKSLRTPWPYLGGVVALLVILPHLIWNSNNDWVTLRFQLTRGLTNSHEVSTSWHNPLPSPILPPPAGSVEDRFGNYFTDPLEIEKPEPPKSQLQRAGERMLEFVLTQFLMWGFLTIAIMSLWATKYFKKSRFRSDIKINLYAKPLLQVATWLPLAVFFGVCLFSKVEANWAAVYMVAAAALLTPFLQNQTRFLLVGSLANLLLVFSLVTHASSPRFIRFPSSDRVLRETHGFNKLADYISTLAGPKFAESYQLVSMIRFYAPEMSITQWPGLTRDSEFVRSDLFMPYALEDLVLARDFWIVSSNKTVGQIPRFAPVAMAELRDCNDGSLVVTPADVGKVFNAPCKGQFVHRWYLVKYHSLSP